MHCKILYCIVVDCIVCVDCKIFSLRIRLCVYVCMYGCKDGHMCVRTYACMHVCMYALLHVCIVACMHVRMYACISCKVMYCCVISSNAV